MSKLSLLLGAVLTLISLHPASADNQPTLEEVRTQILFAPNGFDDNDEAEVVLDGYLPDTCYSLADVKASVDMSTKTVTLQQTAKLFKGEVCYDMIVPYTSVARLGNLPEGSYTVRTKDGARKETLTVKKSAVSAKDDFLYAPVEEVSIVDSAEGQVAWLSGRFTNTCMQMREVKLSDSGKTIEILPVMKVVPNANGEACVNSEKSFSVPVQLPAKEYGRYLAHVRSLNGQAINKVYSVKRK